MIKIIFKYITDINECELSRDNCSSKAECFNNEGSFTCKCLKGYRGDGVLCIGKNNQISSTVRIQLQINTNLYVYIF
jgi:hypothetical protein